jgi:hypothetical protein
LLFELRSAYRNLPIVLAQRIRRARVFQTGGDTQEDGEALPVFGLSIGISGPQPGSDVLRRDTTQCGPYGRRLGYTRAPSTHTSMASTMTWLRNLAGVAPKGRWSMHTF